MRSCTRREGAILASIAPPEMMSVLRWMVPSITASARGAMFTGMRAQMPPPVFAGIFEAATGALDVRNIAKLDRALWGARPTAGRRGEPVPVMQL